jgi:hypothetical protein
MSTRPHAGNFMVEAELLVVADPSAEAMQAALAPLGFALKPLSRARLFADGLLKATLVWRCRRRRSSVALNIVVETVVLQ